MNRDLQQLKISDWEATADGFELIATCPRRISCYQITEPTTGPVQHADMTPLS